jgi:hypothetical protein
LRCSQSLFPIALMQSNWLPFMFLISLANRFSAALLTQFFFAPSLIRLWIFQIFPSCFFSVTHSAFRPCCYSQILLYAVKSKQAATSIFLLLLF